jgi:hypothetical protein
MNIFTKTAKAIVLGAVVAALAAPVSQAGTKLPPDPGLGGRIGYNILYRDQLRAASEVPATRASGVVDDYFRDRQATPVQRIIAQEQARGLAVDDYFRDAEPTLSADERYLNTVASGQASTVQPSVSVDDWFRDRQVEAAPVVAQSPSGGFHVGDALIGAGASLGLMLLAAMGIRQRREHQHLKSA